MTTHEKEKAPLLKGQKSAKRFFSMLPAIFTHSPLALPVKGAPLAILFLTVALGLTHCSSSGGGGGGGGTTDPDPSPADFVLSSFTSDHACALLSGNSLKCWGEGQHGKLGQGNTNDIGDNETPADISSIDLGSGRSAKAVSAGDSHTCALLDDNSLKCWGQGTVYGQLGQGNTNNIGDNETPADISSIDLGSGRSAKAVSAGGVHTCALLDDNSIKCWGQGTVYGQPGQGNTNNIGDNETPADISSINLGSGRSAKALSAGGSHTCALLDDNSIKCWGRADSGQLGQGNTLAIGDDETPADISSIDLGGGRSAKAVSVGGNHTCAILDDNSLKCWGYGQYGKLGQGNTLTIGDGGATGGTDHLSVAEAPSIDLGSGRSAKAVSAGNHHTCALLDDNSIKCWGYGSSGRIGQGNTLTIGDGGATGGTDHLSAAAAPSIDLGGGRSAKAVGAGNHTCALLDDDSIKCWGQGALGRLGQGNTDNLGDDETPADIPPISF